MSALVDWLRAQIDWDAQDLRPLVQWARSGIDSSQGRLTHMQGTTALMSARRALAELDSKRRILDECEADLQQRGGGAMDGNVDRPTWTILTLLALPYADRPGCRDEWRPAGATA